MGCENIGNRLEKQIEFGWVIVVMRVS